MRDHPRDSDPRGFDVRLTRALLLSPAGLPARPSSSHRPEHPPRDPHPPVSVPSPQDNQELTFKVKRTTAFSKIIAKWADTQGQDQAQLRFMFDGHMVNPEDTPERRGCARLPSPRRRPPPSLPP